MSVSEQDVLAAAAAHPSALRWCDRRNAAYLDGGAGSTLEVTGQVRDLGKRRLIAFDGDQLTITPAGERELTST